MAWVGRVCEGGVKRINSRDLGGNLLGKADGGVHADFRGHHATVPRVSHVRTQRVFTTPTEASPFHSWGNRLGEAAKFPVQGHTVGKGWGELNPFPPRGQDEALPIPHPPCCPPGASSGGVKPPPLPPSVARAPSPALDFIPSRLPAPIKGGQAVPGPVGKIPLLPVPGELPRARREGKG